MKIVPCMWPTQPASAWLEKRVPNIAEAMVVNAGNVHEKKSFIYIYIYIFLTTFHLLSLLLVTKTMTRNQKHHLEGNAIPAGYCQRAYADIREWS